MHILPPHTRTHTHITHATTFASKNGNQTKMAIWNWSILVWAFFLLQIHIYVFLLSHIYITITQTQTYMYVIPQAKMAIQILANCVWAFACLFCALWIHIYLNTHLFYFLIFLLPSLTHSKHAYFYRRKWQSETGWFGSGPPVRFSHTSNTHIRFYFLTHILPSHKPKHTWNWSHRRKWQSKTGRFGSGPPVRFAHSGNRDSCRNTLLHGARSRAKPPLFLPSWWLFFFFDSLESVIHATGWSPSV